MQLNKIILAVTVSGLAMTTAHANFAGDSSNESKIQVGLVDDKNHSTDSEGNVGIAVIDTSANAPSVTNKYVDMAGLKAKADSTMTRALMNIGGQDSAGVVQLDFNNWNLPKSIPDHTPLGKFSYKELPNQVYFGEWHQAASTNAADKDRTVFYAGKDAVSKPTSGTATYQVVGINQYNGKVGGLWAGWTGNRTTANANNLLHGTLTANFNKGTLKGSLNRAVNGGANVTNKLDINGSIKSTGNITGNAVANNSVKGKVNGQLFGAGASSVAGVATFNGKTQFDTAFGGTKK